MSRFLGTRVATGRIDPANVVAAGNWTATFQPSDFRIHNSFQIKHISLKGPASSAVQVYVDTTYFDATPRGDLNSWDPAQPLPLHPGQALYFYWNSATATPVPQVTVYCYANDLF